jgi:hypothetical protein
VNTVVVSSLDLSLRRSGFDLRPICMGFEVDKVALGHVFLGFEVAKVALG